MLKLSVSFLRFQLQERTKLEVSKWFLFQGLFTQSEAKILWCLSFHLYRQPTKLREGNVFSRVCSRWGESSCDHYSWYIWPQCTGPLPGHDTWHPFACHSFRSCLSVNGRGWTCLKLLTWVPSTHMGTRGPSDLFKLFPVQPIHLSTSGWLPFD